MFPHPVAGNRRGGLIFYNPVPLGPVYLARMPRISVSGEGVLSFVTAAPDPGPRPEPRAAFLRWEDVRTVAEQDGRVQVNSEPFLCAAKGEGREIAESLTALAELDPEAREAEIGRRVARATDVGAIKARVEECERATATLGLTTTLLFVLLFAVIPLVARRYGVDSTWKPLLLGLYAATASNHLVFWRAHRRLYPEDRPGRLKALLLMVVAPPAAIRAGDAVTLPLLTGFHPLAASAALSGDEPFREFARGVLRDSAHPRADTLAAVPAAAAATEESFRRRIVRALFAAVRTRSVEPEELLAPAPRRDKAAVAACPRCGAEFLRSDVVCEDCGGLGLLLIGAAEATSVDSPDHEGT